MRNRCNGKGRDGRAGGAGGAVLGNKFYAGGRESAIVRDYRGDGLLASCGFAECGRARGARA